MINQKNILFGVIAYIVSAVLSYFIFVNVLPHKKVVTPPTPIKKDENGQLSFDGNLPKTETCPLNGAMYSKQQRDWWEKHRPLGVMIENSKDARPQSGLSFSDVVYEAVAEGGITRFLPVFYCQDAGVVGPVRSARTYFLDFISEYGTYPLYAHVGGANTPGPADALSQINDYGWGTYNDMNQFSIGFPTFWRDYERLGHNVSTEHTMYSTTQKLWDFAKTRGLTQVDKDGDAWDTEFVKYTFKNDAASALRPASQTISFGFSDFFTGDYSVKWDYNKETNTYLRTNGSERHTDRNNGKQLSAKNIIILFMRESHANDGYEDNQHLLYGTKGTGRALVFTDGKKVEATWSKKARTSRTILKSTAGEDISFTRGRLWFEILPIGTDVTVK